MNKQPIEKRSLRADGLLDIYSIFGPTFQGEGPFAGTPCVFVRLAGCNLQCPGCDTIYTGPKRINLNPEDVLHFIKVAMFNARAPLLDKSLVVISGGEPFRQNIAPLIELLLEHDFYVQIETNGTLAPSLVDDPTGRKGLSYLYNTDITERRGAYIVVSPKAGKVNELTEHLACAYKYVMSHDSIADDGLPIQALDHSVKVQVARPPKDYKGMIYLQPMDHGISATNAEWDEDSPNAKSLEAVKASCLKHGYILCLQIHKIIGVE